MQTSVTIYRPRGIRLSGRHLRRQPPRPIDKRQSGYSEAYDELTIIYDAIRTDPTTVLLVCPPLENLVDHLKIHHCGQPLAWRVISLDRVTRIIVKVPDSSSEFVLTIGAESFLVDTTASEVSSFLAGERVLQTLSQNNPLTWLTEWAEYYTQLHSTTAIVLYDNKSNRYSCGDISKALQGVAGLRKAIIVNWDYPYGPGGGTDQVWDSDYCQHGTFEHSRHLLTRSSRSLINADIDELILSFRTVGCHALAEASPFGGISIPGVWVKSEIKPNGLPHYLDALTGTVGVPQLWSPPKWAVVPQRIPEFAQLRTHKLRRWLIPKVPGVSYRHFKSLTINWRSDTSGWDYRKVGELSKTNEVRASGPCDESLQAALARVSWPDRQDLNRSVDGLS